MVLHGLVSMTALVLAVIVCACMSDPGAMPTRKAGATPTAATAPTASPSVLPCPRCGVPWASPTP